MAFSAEHVEELFHQQWSTGEEIIKAYTNYSKLPLADRANLAVVTAKIKNVCDLFSCFERTHENLKAVPEEGEYFTKGYFERIEQLHEENIVKLLTDKENIEKTITSIDPQMLPKNLRKPDDSSTSRTGQSIPPSNNKPTGTKRKEVPSNVLTVDMNELTNMIKNQ